MPIRQRGAIAPPGHEPEGTSLLWVGQAGGPPFRRFGGPYSGPYIVMRIATSYLVTEARRPGVSPAGIAFSTSWPRR